MLNLECLCCLQSFNSCSLALPVLWDSPYFAMIVTVLVLAVQCIFPISDITLVILLSRRPWCRCAFHTNGRPMFVTRSPIVEIKPVTVME